VEVIPGLSPEVSGIAPAYCAGLLVSFANPSLAHQTAQIAMDGSQKLPLRVLPSIRRNLELGLPIDRLALVVAAWINYLGGRDEQGRRFVPDDPLRDRLQRLAGAPDCAGAATMIVRQAQIFGDLAGHDDLANKVALWLERLRTQGALATLAAADPV
jgi:fructuronate reductase